MFKRDQLRTLQNTVPSSKYVATVGSSDGAYQQRSGKSGGGFSRYCFAAAVIAETGKVVAYNVACNSCNICSILQISYRGTKLQNPSMNLR